ncbi:helix-turn-helix domain-containing protein [Burkholderia cenocepacia]|uniref:helix-turn-helix domain-containing protein n=1 Tax=Burkholderia cenocepacia TaxID=95486 RepID=UPI002AB7E5AD|nr:helix-turn-helix domain-containing protein [Burkholderia cenocepacia]
MADPMEELRATAARLKRESDELVRRVDALPRHRESVGVSLSEEQILQIAQRAVDLFKQESPRPVHVTQAQAAEMLGLTARTVHTLVRTGKLKLNGIGRIPISEIDMLLARTRDK